IQEARGRLGRRIPPREIDPKDAPVNEIVLTGDQIDLTQFPVPKHWPLDGGGQPGDAVGRYIGTADAVFTRDPDTGIVNIGTYRMMVQGKNEVGLYLSPGSTPASTSPGPGSRARASTSRPAGASTRSS